MVPTMNLPLVLVEKLALSIGMVDRQRQKLFESLKKLNTMINTKQIVLMMVNVIHADDFMVEQCV